jgi:hypothetical protein
MSTAAFDRGGPSLYGGGTVRFQAWARVVAGLNTAYFRPFKGE